ncbi:sulfatase family protein [Calycomorphotria hydatis]|uniref:Arylsulfatase n=1 Tax=Calycomorphotria hydatis TaxID=2528027 RepID=A0A517T417_9PLAN|nr:sulfatase [Calycomorphotria hydatis]QDT63118.1 Arylsulfatase [Calycomorphotria hydatis]
MSQCLHFVLGIVLFFGSVCSTSSAFADDRPNILFCLADDWGWPHAGVYGDPVVRTEAFDRLAREGVLFENAYISSPSCTPSRNAVITGQHFFRLGRGANLWSTLDTHYPAFPLLLSEAGYETGRRDKSWGPGDLSYGGYTDTHPIGKRYKDFKDFYKDRSPEKPFFFWLGSADPHRSYKEGTGRESGLDVSKVPVPEFYPDAEVIRSDIADYYFEVERFNQLCMDAIELLEANGELENTIVVMSGDHGMPFPRCKSNLYDWGTKVPLAIRWGAKVKGAREVTDFVSLCDVAPTFLEAAGVDVPNEMTYQSLLPLLESEKSGRVDAKRDHILIGRERHTPAQEAPSVEGYPCRALRNDQFLYIRNYRPDLWPAGSPTNSTRHRDFADCDDGPTKAYLVENQNDPAIRPYFELSFVKRPAEELYDLASDPDQIHNLAGDEKFASVRKELAAQLTRELTELRDPREVGGAEVFIEFDYLGGAKKKKPVNKKIKN